METYENQNPKEEKQELLQEDIQTEVPVEANESEIPNTDKVDSFEEAKPDKKVSPYADSPYVMNHPAPEASQPKKMKKEKKSGGFWKKALCAILAVVLVAGACVATAAVVNDYWEGQMENMEDSFEDRFAELEKKIKSANVISGSVISSSSGGLTPAQVYAMNVNSVVLIHNEITTKYNGQVSTGTSTGSGFVLTEDGYVVTNHHVVDGDGTLSVITYDGTKYPARLIGSDQTNDVALLKVEAEGLRAVTLGSSNDLIVGDQVVAIGNPLGELTSTLTVGYISAKERDVNTDGFAINMLQTDAAINSGNSGGPLFNMRGEVIGITTAKYSGTSGGGASIEGVGFAIPIDDVSDLLSDLATHGYVKGAYLGVSVSDMDPNAANYYGLPLGAYVQSVEQGFAAQRAGIQHKDIITSIGEITVETVNDLTRALRSFKAGDSTVVTVYRGGKELKLQITLDEKPGNVQ